MNLARVSRCRRARASGSPCRRRLAYPSAETGVGQTPFPPSPNWRLRRSARLGRSVLKAPVSVGPSRPLQRPAAPSPQTDFGSKGPQIWREYHVFANRADAERSVIGFEAEGFRAKIYRTASWPIGEDAIVQDNHHRRHTWGVIVSGQAKSRPGVSAATDTAG